MPIEFKEDRAIFHDMVNVDEAEGLLDRLQKGATEIDLSACSHLHPANLQVLLAAKVHIALWPNDANLRGWLENLLIPSS